MQVCKAIFLMQVSRAFTTLLPHQITKAASRTANQISRPDIWDIRTFKGFPKQPWFNKLSKELQEKVLDICKKIDDTTISDEIGLRQELQKQQIETALKRILKIISDIE